ncbi:hypothetical protein A1O1_04648 [Capronia coronata CBS 617.96]|uniref:Uncharacterized protein n=1 Tax=Capronia coronata CBS 617.96 TaxID=1182541 RepID=W9Y5B9_9EURO|nr:uncharacterized protein A1O1_04648 [Capronia coronata CBS 617.96]EXJ87723.1 hypothetical protein A1O1_04648 [Capronia coronata CBS 617.96]
MTTAKRRAKEVKPKTKTFTGYFARSLHVLSVLHSPHLILTQTTNLIDAGHAEDERSNATPHVHNAVAAGELV